MIFVFAYMIGVPTVVSLSFVMNGCMLFREFLLHNSTTNNTTISANLVCDFVTCEQQEFVHLLVDHVDLYTDVLLLTFPCGI